MNRFKKVYRDLLLKKSRTILVILAITLGIFGVGAVLNTNYILIREMDRNYMETNPASFIVWMEQADEKLISIMNNMPEIEDVELRKTITGRIRTGKNEWSTIILYVIPDFNRLKVDTFSPEEGKSVPSESEILIERDAFNIAKTSLGQSAEIKIPGGQPQELTVSGSVHAPGLPAAHSEHFAYGFISPETLKLLGHTGTFDELRAVISGNRYDIKAIEDAAVKSREAMTKSGYQIRNIEIPAPGKHPHGDEISGFMFVVQAFGVLSLIMSSVLVVNMISNLLSGQIRQIGIMKAIGAQTGQIIGMYYVNVLVLGFIALLIGIPMAVLMGNASAGISAMELNFNIEDYSIPFISFVVQGLTGLFIPMLAASIPIIKACNVSVKEAISDYGISQGNSTVKNNKEFAKPPGIWVLSTRNMVRKKSRLFLTLGTLVLGGSLFVLSLNIYTSLNNTVEQTFKALQYDVEVRLSKHAPISKLSAASKNIKGIRSVEYVNFSAAVIKRKESIASKQYLLKAVPTDSQLIKLQVLEGRWYSKEDKDCVVINHNLASKEPDIKVGDTVEIFLEGRNLTVTVIGIAKEVASRPTIYMNRETYLNVTGQKDTNYILFKTSHRNYDIQREVLSAFELNALERNIDIFDAWMTYQHKRSFLDHLTMVLGFLVFMAVLTVIVGGMGLASTMSISVLERMREIGVMRSIGASGSDINKMILLEGLVIGVVSWIIVCILSVPLAPTLGNIIGEIALHIKLDTAFSIVSYAFWLILVIAITVFSSLLPAIKASNTPVKDIIAYE